MHESIIGTRFRGTVTDVVADGVVTEIEGMAYCTGRHEFVVDPDDPVGTGFVLR
jgi:proline racemase/trans-L-3-hydroxyproline dehydratase